MFFKNWIRAFTTTLLLVILCYFVLSFFVIGYDEGMNVSRTAMYCSGIMKSLIFSLDVWVSWRLSGIMAVIFSFATTAFIISFPWVIIKNLRTIQNQKI